MASVKIKIKNTSGLPLPEYQTPGAAAFDMRAVVSKALVLQPKERAVVPTGIHIALPDGYELQIRGRSSLAAKHGIGLVNGVGTIDSDYRGEIRVILINHGQEPFAIEHGDRIAQAVVARYETAEFIESDELEPTQRGEGGFGSTGRT
jgi:dUTP pyrophosphatase